AGEGRAETCQVGATVTLRNDVGEAEDILVEAIVPLQCHLHTHTVFLTLYAEMEDLVDDGLVGIQVLDASLEATLVLEQLFLPREFIIEQKADTGVKERQLPQANGQVVPDDANVFASVFRRPEVNLHAGSFALAHGGEWRLQ